MVSLYVHIPFCERRCNYCDFPTWAGLARLIRPYGAAVLHELELLSPWLVDHQVGTLYLGGGTPSLLPSDILCEIVQAVPLGPEAEVTVEANPCTLTPTALILMREAGFNRLSLGMQSADKAELELLGRRHEPDAVSDAVRWARAAGFDNLNLDLIYGIPGQTMEPWIDTIATALDLRPEHLSLYALSIEPGTAFDRWVKNGRLPGPDPDQAAVMYELAQNQLHLAGYVHYEISNWSLPGYSATHNLAYWRNQAYLGIGAAAWGHWPAGDSSWRMHNVLHPSTYIERLGRQPRSSGKGLPVSPACIEQEFVPRPWAMAEMMFMGLRLVREGVSRAAFKARFGVDPVLHYCSQLEALEARGWIEWDDEAIRLSAEALLISNQVLVAFLPS